MRASVLALTLVSAACSPVPTEVDAGVDLPRAGGSAGGRAGGGSAGGAAAVPRLAIDQASGAFGPVEAGTVSNAIVFQISNAGGDYTGPLEVSVEGARFRLGINTCSMDSLFAGASCEVRVTFAPVAVEGSIGRLVVRGMPGGEVSASLAGTGTSPTTATLTVSKSGTGSGTVTGMGIACGSDCSDVGPVNRSVMLTAAPLPGSQFGGWTGCDSVTMGTCTVTMASSRSVTASFTGNSMMGAMATLTVMKTGPGTISGMGITCGVDCTESVPVGTTVTLTAMPMSGSTFVEFLGCDTTMGPSCTLTLNGSRSISATFEAAATHYTLTVAKSGSGTGLITGTGITCGVDCNEVVPAGTMRTVSAVPSSNSVLSGWSGCDQDLVADCIISVTSNRTVTATFVATAAPTAPRMLTASVLPNGEVELNWVDTATNEVDFRIDRSSQGTTGFVEVATLPADTTTTTLPGLMVGTYYFRVRATNGGGASGPSNTAVLTLTAPPVQLSVVKTGTGMGTVTSVPAGISCGTDCSETLPAGTMVVLTAAPATGASFMGWTGCTSTTTTSCTVALASTRTVTAAFGLLAGSLMVSAPAASTTGTFSVSWSCGSGACGTPYTLEEDPTGSFISPSTVVVSAATTQGFMNKADGRYCYRVRTPLMTSNVACVVVSRPGSTGVLRVENLTKYDLIDYRLNGSQRTSYPFVVAVGQSDDVVFQPGLVTYDLGVGFWNGPTREVWFLYSGTAQVFAGQTTLISIENPTLQQMLTNFGPNANWDGQYLSSGMLRTRRMAFDPVGSYALFDNGAQVSTGTVELVAWPNYATTISFRLCTPVCAGAPIELDYPFAAFIAPNGPPASPNVTYYLQ
ncbi:MAG: fibronectin type III domain-containing protein [Myxococcales bacterium]|nr:fibronectin type III domain-containing protein [Myxococcales bacterium]